MDFIERMVGISPDNGSGWLEFSLFLALLLVVALVRRNRLRDHPSKRTAAGSRD